MGTPQPITPLSIDDYLVAERDAEVRHEYVDGERFAMAGASRRHNRLTLNVAAALLTHLGDGPCRVSSSDMKVHVTGLGRFYYPDVLVSCTDPADEPDEYVETSPRLIVEVLSASTEATDRREKRLAYCTLESLEEYVLVHLERMLVEVFRRTRGRWTCTEYGADESLVLSSVGFEREVRALYAGTSIGR